MDSAITSIARAAKAASRSLATAPRSVKDAALLAMADALVARGEAVLAANAEDVARARAAGMRPGLVDRLTLTAERVDGIAGVQVNA